MIKIEKVAEKSRKIRSHSVIH